MEIHEWIMSLGAIGTTTSALVAVVTYVKTTKKNQLITQADTARLLRERLQRVLTETQKLQQQVHSGTALIVATAAIAHEIEARLSPVTTQQEIEEVLSNSHLLLSAAITGWQKSRASVEVSDRISQLELEASQLPGGMQALNELVKLLSVAIDDGYSPMILHKILVLRGKEPDLEYELNSNQKTKRLIDQVKVAVQSNASVYYLARYDKAIKAMREFVEILVAALCSLPDEILVQLGNTTSSRRVVGATRTASIRQLLRELNHALDMEDITALNDIVNNLEVFLDKNHAVEEANNLHHE